ncbi:MAG: hypothetical protein C0391_08645 [Anaerolinea sp.]|nr:hypothetical protein [Anaerolinea sp.]
MTIRNVRLIQSGKPTVEGAGVHLNRAFGFGQTSEFDPYLMLDDFRGDDPELYQAGFPWHPHRGIETITYMLEGKAEHQDSLGNKGIIDPGDVQWMTAGSGIIHQEMPIGNANGKMGGFQLWANLPSDQKMMDPRYREIKSTDIPDVQLPGGGSARVIAGNVNGVTGSVSEIVIAPEYLDVRLPANATFKHPTTSSHTVFCYVYSGSGNFVPEGTALAKNGGLVLFEVGDEIMVTAGDEGVRFLLISGEPLYEPVAWYGPIVMNTQEELNTAMRELRENSFIKFRG